MRKGRTMKEKIEIDGVIYMAVTEVSGTVLIRTYSAGVHFGTLVKREGGEVVLNQARRLHRWSGACSLNQVAIDGVDLANSRISVSVPEITILGVIEIIPMSTKASKQMLEAESWKS